MTIRATASRAPRFSRVGIDWAKEWEPSIHSLRFGVVRYGVDLLRGLRSIRPDLAVIVYSPQREPHPALSQIPWGSNGWEWRWQRPPSRRPQWFFQSLRRTYLALKDGLDLIHCLEPATTPFCPVPYVSTCHDVMPDVFGEPFVKSRGYRRLKRYNRAPWMQHVASSRCTRDDLVRLWRIPEKRVTFAHLASSFFPPLVRPGDDVWGRLRDRLPDPDSPFLVGLFNLLPRKNLDALLPAFATLAASHPRLRLVLFGRTGHSLDRQEWYERTITALNVRNRIDRLDPVDDAEMAELYRRAIAFVFPSIYEGFGFPVLEAMSVGACVVARGASSMAEIVEHAGILTETADPVALGDAIRRVIDDPARNQALRAQAVTRAKAFTVENMARQTLVAYEKAVATWYRVH